MPAVTRLLKELHDDESDLVEQLHTIAHEHVTDYEVRHGATHLARWSREHVRRLADVGRGYDLDVSATVEADGGSPVKQLREKAAETMGHRPEPALLLLRDLRELHASTTRVDLEWEMLSQTAKALRDERLLELASDCRSQTRRQMKWTDTLIKELTPQAMTSATQGG